MTHYILNSAVITAPGIYRYRLLTPGEAAELLRVWCDPDAYPDPPISYVGYEETAEAMAVLLNYRPAINRQTVKMMPGDQALVFRLTKRLSQAEMKGKLGLSLILFNCEIGLLERLR